MKRALAILFFAAACNAPSQPTGTDMSSASPDMVFTGYLPAGTMLTPFLSSTPQYSFSAADKVLTNGKDYYAVLETDAGRIVFDLLEKDTPITVNSFVFLARNHYFDGQAFHRVIDGFMAQGGDPNTISGDPRTWGVGGPGYSFGLEIVSSLNYDNAGFVGMARTMDPNSNGSQFFITFAATHSLDGQYTIFAKVIEGIDVLPSIVRGQPPANPTRVTSLYITEK
jgi:peptidylprolyl isomerase